MRICEKIDANLWKSVKNHANLWKSLKNRFQSEKSMQIYENLWKINANLKNPCWCCCCCRYFRWCYCDVVVLIVRFLWSMLCFFLLQTKTKKWRLLTSNKRIWYEIAGSTLAILSPTGERSSRCYCCCWCRYFPWCCCDVVVVILCVLLFMLLLLLLKPKSPKWKFPTSNKRNRDSIAAINLTIMIPIGVGHIRCYCCCCCRHFSWSHCDVVVVIVC